MAGDRLVRLAGVCCIATAVLHLVGMFPDFAGAGALGETASAWGLVVPYMVVAAATGVWALTADLADDIPTGGALAVMACGTTALWFGLCDITLARHMAPGIALHTAGDASAIGAGLLGFRAYRGSDAARQRMAPRQEAIAVLMVAAVVVAIVGFILKPTGGTVTYSLFDLPTNTMLTQGGYLVSLLALAVLFARTGDRDAPFAVLAACGWMAGRAVQAFVDSTVAGVHRGAGVFLVAAGLLTLLGIAIFERVR